jgi:hypothetical protein
MKYRQSVVTFLGLLNALPLTAKASSAMDTPSQKFASMVERDSIPYDIQEYALTQLNIDLQTDEGRRQLFLLLSAANPAPDHKSSMTESISVSQEDCELFASLKECVGIADPKIIEGLALMIMVIV